MPANRIKTSSTTIKDRGQQLNAIEDVILCIETPGWSPRVGSAVVLAGLSFFLVGPIVVLLDANLLLVPSTASVVALVAFSRWGGPSTWHELLQQLVVAYAKEYDTTTPMVLAGSTDMVEVWAWLDRERALINHTLD